LCLNFLHRDGNAQAYGNPDQTHPIVWWNGQPRSLELEELIKF
jgi:hypothetical protein